MVVVRLEECHHWQIKPCSEQEQNQIKPCSEQEQNGPKMDPKWTQNGPKMDPKWTQLTHFKKYHYSLPHPNRSSPLVRSYGPWRINKSGYCVCQTRSGAYINMHALTAPPRPDLPGRLSIDHVNRSTRGGASTRAQTLTGAPREVGHQHVLKP
jgi:hypothetical protein